MLGGGGAKRSDVRFSPVVAALEGRARFRSLVHPDSRYQRGRDGKRPAGPVGDARLPYGGVLYDLEVTRVLWVLDKAGWAALQSRLRPLLRPAELALRKGRFAAASAAA